MVLLLLLCENENFHQFQNIFWNSPLRNWQEHYSMTAQRKGSAIYLIEWQQLEIEVKKQSTLCFYQIEPKGSLQFWLPALLQIHESHLISKANCQAVNSSKKEQMNSFMLLPGVFSFVFWKKLKTPRRHFEINWPLGTQNKNHFSNPARGSWKHGHLDPLWKNAKFLTPACNLNFLGGQLTSFEVLRKCP